MYMNFVFLCMGNYCIQAVAAAKLGGALTLSVCCMQTVFELTSNEPFAMHHLELELIFELELELHVGLEEVEERGDVVNIGWVVRAQPGSLEPPTRSSIRGRG
jgi:hypothetical protein